jgi:hypothetical protein
MSFSGLSAKKETVEVGPYDVIGCIGLAGWLCDLEEL